MDSVHVLRSLAELRDAAASPCVAHTLLRLILSYHPRDRGGLYSCFGGRVLPSFMSWGLLVQSLGSACCCINSMKNPHPFKNLVYIKSCQLPRAVVARCNHHLMFYLRPYTKELGSRNPMEPRFETSNQGTNAPCSGCSRGCSSRTIPVSAK